MTYERFERIIKRINERYERLISKGVIKLNKLQGIYGIYNATKQKWYIGQSHNIRTRISKHKTDLKNGKHPCKEMQTDYNNGDIFEYYALRINVNTDDLDLAENLYIQELCYARENKGYNKNPVSYSGEYGLTAKTLQQGLDVSATDSFSIIITMKAFARLKGINISDEDRRKLVLKETEKVFEEPFALD